MGHVTTQRSAVLVKYTTKINLRFVIIYNAQRHSNWLNLNWFQVPVSCVQQPSKFPTGCKAPQAKLRQGVSFFTFKLTAVTGTVNECCVSLLTAVKLSIQLVDTLLSSETERKLASKQDCLLTYKITTEFEQDLWPGNTHCYKVIINYLNTLI